MPEIPSVFNRIDFMSILLPGYVTIISYLIVFQPTVFFTDNQLSFDIISAVIFIVAGPAVGMTILQFHRGLVAIYSKIRYRETDEEFLNNYALVRSKMNNDEKKVLDETEAYYDFSVSTGLSFCTLSIYVLIKLGISTLEPLVIFIVGGPILLLLGYIERTDSYGPMFKCLFEKYTKSKPKHYPFVT